MHHTLIASASPAIFSERNFTATALSNLPPTKIPVLFIMHSLMQHPFGGCPPGPPGPPPPAGGGGLGFKASHFWNSLSGMASGSLQHSVGHLPSGSPFMHSGGGGVAKALKM